MPQQSNGNIVWNELRNTLLIDVYLSFFFFPLCCFCPTSGTIRVTLVANLTTSHDTDKWYHLFYQWLDIMITNIMINYLTRIWSMTYYSTLTDILQRGDMGRTPLRVTCVGPYDMNYNKYGKYCLLSFVLSMIRHNDYKYHDQLSD
jgi:hypothetical protein